MSQIEFQFQNSGGEGGYTGWITSRGAAIHELGRRINLPLGREVEVWLRDGIRLKGTLRLAQDVLYVQEDRLRQLELKVDHVTFTYGEMESCVRLD